jgi:hypothetical protein
MLDFEPPSPPPTPAPVSTKVGIPYIRALGAQIQSESGLKVCGAVAASAQIEIGWEAVAGRYAGYDCEYVSNYPDDTVPHCWNVLPDGTIVDATANQFDQFDLGEPMPRIILPNDRRQAWYLVRVGGLCSGLYKPGWCSDHPARDAYAKRGIVPTSNTSTENC